LFRRQRGEGQLRHIQGMIVLVEESIYTGIGLYSKDRNKVPIMDLTPHSTNLSNFNTLARLLT
jgi:hypothetical protein